MTQYANNIKAHAIELIIGYGMTELEVSSIMDIPLQTVYRWIREYKGKKWKEKITLESKV